MDPPPTGDPLQVADGPTPASLNSGIAKALAAWSPAELSPEEVAQHTKTLQRLVDGRAAHLQLLADRRFVEILARREEQGDDPVLDGDVGLLGQRQ